MANLQDFKVKWKNGAIVDAIQSVDLDCASGANKKISIAFYDLTDPANPIKVGGYGKNRFKVVELLDCDGSVILLDEEYLDVKSLVVTDCDVCKPIENPFTPKPPIPITAGETELIVKNETGAGSVPAGAFRVEVSNVGFGNGIINGAVLPSGKNSYFEYSHFDALENKQYYLPEITYDATGTEFFISIYKPL
jgi:hypothetical protein